MELEQSAELIAQWLNAAPVESAAQRLRELDELERHENASAAAPYTATEAEVMQNCLHESAHAVLAHRMGLRIRRVCCRADGTGYVTHEAPPPTSIGAIFPQIVIGLAGVASELLGGTADRSRRAFVARGSDLMAAQLSLAECRAYAPDTEITPQLAARVSCGAVFANWREITRIAYVLRELGELDGPTLAALCGPAQ